MATQETTAPEEDTESTGGRKKLLVLLAVLLIAGGAAAYFFLFADSGEAAAEAPEPGGVVVLDPIAVNLAGGGYLKIGITLQLTAEAGGHEGDGVDGSKALDLVISTFSQANPADVTGARDALKEALEKKVVDAYTEHGTEMVMGIYYNEYVTQ